MQNMLKKIWEDKNLYIGIIAITALITFGSSFLVKETFSSSALLKPNDLNSNAGQQLGGLNLNLPIGGLSSNNSEIELAVEILRSKDFFDSLLKQDELNIKDNLILMNNLKIDASFDELFESFHRYNLDIYRNTDNNFVRISANYIEPNTAKIWAEQIIDNLNSFSREREIALANDSIKFLEERLKTETTSAIKTAITGLIESEYQKLMLAEVSVDYAFIVIDSPRTPDKKSKPIRSLYLSLGIFLGFFISFLVLFFRSRFS